MPRHDGTDNLIPNSQRTPEELREMTRKGGIKSGEARRRKRDTKATAKMVLELIPNLPPQTQASLAKMGLDPETKPDVRLLAMLQLAQKAMNGDFNAIKMLLDYGGYIDARTQLDKDRLKLEKERAQLQAQKRGPADVRPIIDDVRPDDDEP
ncbi:MAG: hypothetical protein IJG86_01810 [Clostridia bacterium]|nr:hypothetical protein [Clostridia bacterium]